MSKEPPRGGAWDIDIDAGAGLTAAVELEIWQPQPLRDPRRVDELIDDGNPDTGSFRFVAMGAGRPY